MMIQDYEYKKIIDPDTFFNSDEDFERFININDMSSKEDYIGGLNELLKLCAERDMFERCRMILDILKTYE